MRAQGQEDREAEEGTQAGQALGTRKVPQLPQVIPFSPRAHENQNMNQTILRLEGVNDKNSAQYYFGKRVAYVYKKHSGKKEDKFRVGCMLFRPSGDVSALPMATLAPCSLASARTSLLEPLAPP